MAEQWAMVNEELDVVLPERAARLLEQNEPELWAGIRAAVARGGLPETVRRAVMARVGRRDTALMAEAYAVWLLGKQGPVEG